MIREMKKRSIVVTLSVGLAFVGSVLTLVQFFLLMVGGDGICLNQGCKVIDKLTLVPPAYINIAGFLYFLAVMFVFWFTERSEKTWPKIIDGLLLSGLAAESVLVGFQYFVVGSFCSYCLIILSLIILLNMLQGMKHIFIGGVTFLAVIVTFASLNFSSGSIALNMSSLESGSFAYINKNTQEKRQHFLFFSSSCPHCEAILGSLQKNPLCNMSFNPVGPIESISIIGAQLNEEYSIDSNRNFLNTLGIDEVPVLVVMDESGMQILKGGLRIQDYIEKNCLTFKKIEYQKSGAQTPLPGLEFLDPHASDDACSVATDCEESQESSKAQ